MDLKFCDLRKDMEIDFVFYLDQCECDEFNFWILI